MMAVDNVELQLRIRALSEVLAWHAGSIEVANVSSDGIVRVRFLGLCSSCPLRPVTLAATVRRSLLDVEGVTGVEAVGVRLSEEAEARLAALAG